MYTLLILACICSIKDNFIEHMLYKIEHMLYFICICTAPYSYLRVGDVPV